jgi:hypothetical protein
VPITTHTFAPSRCRPPIRERSESKLETGNSKSFLPLLIVEQSLGRRSEILGNFNGTGRELHGNADVRAIYGYGGKLHKMDDQSKPAPSITPLRRVRRLCE